MVSRGYKTSRKKIYKESVLGNFRRKFMDKVKGEECEKPFHILQQYEMMWKKWFPIKGKLKKGALIILGLNKTKVKIRYISTNPFDFPTRENQRMRIITRSRMMSKCSEFSERGGLAIKNLEEINCARVPRTHKFPKFTKMSFGYSENCWRLWINNPIRGVKELFLMFKQKNHAGCLFLQCSLR